MKDKDVVYLAPAEYNEDLHWGNSSNVLCNYMKEQKFLDMILQNKAIIPRYCMEPIEYLQIEGISKICFPMTCFCDIPLSRVSTHMTNYGSYGIGLDKFAVLKRYRIQPVHYINMNSPLTDDFKEAFKASLNNHYTDETAKLSGFLASTLMFMKPISGIRINDGVKESYVYQDECEWRYVPADNFPRDLHLILKQNETTEKGKKKYSEALLHHPECWLKLDWVDVRYIIVPDEIAAKNTIKTIRDLDLSIDEIDLLISKIEISSRFSDNM